MALNVTSLSGLNKTLFYNSFTDNSGSAYFEIGGNITQNLKSINSMEVSSTGNSVISGLDQKESSLNIVNVYLQSTTISDTTIPFIPIILGFLLIIGLILLLGGGFFFYRNYSKSLKENQEYNDYINSITDFLGMYLTNKEGLPIFLKSNQRLEDQNQHLILSGVTYSIDIFLNNFKNEYMTKIIKEENIAGSLNTGLVHMTVINQENFKILIGVSDSYRMYVLIKDINERITRLFQNVLANVEKTVKIKSTIYDLMRIYPLFSKAMEEIFPIELVNEFV